MLFASHLETMVFHTIQVGSVLRLFQENKF